MVAGEKIVAKRLVLMGNIYYEGALPPSLARRRGTELVKEP